jgi:uncharacterized protein YwqG
MPNILSKILKEINDLSTPKDYDLDKHKSILAPSIGFKMSYRKKIKVGDSKFGGIPDLPDNIDWPEFCNQPLSFIGQFNIKDFKKYNYDNLLPKSGIFYVFLYVDKNCGENGTFFLSYKDKSCYKVIYSDSELTQARNESDIVFDEVALSFFSFFTYPNNSDEDYEIRYKSQGLDYSFNKQIDKVQAKLVKQNYTFRFNQLLGYDRPLQYSARYYWAERELKISTQEEYDKHRELIPELAKSYRLFLQIDFNGNFREYGGFSVAYFGIKTEDLAQANFSNIVLSFQDT